MGILYITDNLGIRK